MPQQKRESEGQKPGPDVKMCCGTARPCLKRRGNVAFEMPSLSLMHYSFFSQYIISPPASPNLCEQSRTNARSICFHIILCLRKYDLSCFFLRRPSVHEARGGCFPRVVDAQPASRRKLSAFEFQVLSLVVEKSAHCCPTGNRRRNGVRSPGQA